jgi:hypothetical protein
MRLLADEGNEGNLFLSLLFTIPIYGDSCAAHAGISRRYAKIQKLRWGLERFKMGRQIALIALIAF